MKKTWLVAGLAAAGALLGSIASANTTQIEFCMNVLNLPNNSVIAGTAGLAQNGTALNSVAVQWSVGNTYCATVPQVAGATHVYFKLHVQNTNLTQINLMGNAFAFANIPQMTHMNAQAYYIPNNANTQYDLTPFVWIATYEDGARIGFDGPGTPVKDPTDHTNPNGTSTGTTTTGSTHTGDATGSGDLRCWLQVTPSTSGPAPFTVNVMGYTNWGQFVVLYWGDANWVNNPIFGLSHTYLNPGTYQISAGVAGANNTQFAKCLATINVGPGSATGTGTTNPNGTTGTTTTGTTTTGTTNPGNPNTNPGNPVHTGPWTHSHADAGVAIKWMHGLGLTKFDTYESFQANANITREQAAKFFAQFALKVLKKTANANMNCTFNDDASIDSTLKADVVTACQLGLFKGSKGNFNPKAAITAAEMLTVAMRLKYGMLAESGANRWANYEAKANELGIIGDLDLDLTATSRGAARVNAAFLLYRLSQMME